MKKLIFLALLLIGLNINAQEIMTDWNELNGQTTLKEYIENQAYEYLNFKPNEKDTINRNGVKISHRSTNTKLIIRDQAIVPNIPIIIINGFATDNKETWNSIKLADVKKITLYEANEQLFAIYGTRVKNGLVFVEMEKRKWRKIKRRIR